MPERRKTLVVHTSAVRLRPDAKIPILILRELVVECLQEFPNQWSGGIGCVDVMLRGTIREASSIRLVDVEHVDVVVPTIRIERWY